MRTARRLSDEQLVLRYQQHQSAESSELLYQRYVQKVYQKCLTMTQDSEQARDLTQDIFLTVFHRLDSFQHNSRFSTWLYVISHNCCINRLRDARRMSFESLTDQFSEPESPEETKDEAVDQLYVFLKQLPEADQILIRLRFEQNLRIKQIGEYFQVSEAAIKMRLKRACQRLARFYQSTPYLEQINSP